MKAHSDDVSEFYKMRARIDKVPQIYTACLHSGLDWYRGLEDSAEDLRTLCTQYDVIVADLEVVLAVAAVKPEDRAANVSRSDLNIYNAVMGWFPEAQKPPRATLLLAMTAAEAQAETLQLVLDMQLEAEADKCEPAPEQDDLDCFLRTYGDEGNGATSAGPTDTPLGDSLTALWQSAVDGLCDTGSDEFTVEFSVTVRRG